jgi:hypothetical protein
VLLSRVEVLSQLSLRVIDWARKLRKLQAHRACDGHQLIVESDKVTVALENVPLYTTGAFLERDTNLEFDVLAYVALLPFVEID